MNTKAHPKRLPVGLLALIAVAFTASCSPTDVSNQRSNLVSEILDVQLDVSAQLLKLETDRDALSLGAGSVDCSPDESRATYNKVADELRSLLDDGSKLGIAGTFNADIVAVIEEWSALERRHDSFWRDSAVTANVPPDERCMRPSELVLTRLTMEKKLISAAKAALPQS